MDARAVKDALYARHYAAGGKFPGPWTVIEEWRGIDLLAISAWSSKGRYARVGYEVKVSRADLRAELLRPGKRLANVSWCNEFYFAVPTGLLLPHELAYAEPEWSDTDWRGQRCPGYKGEQCRPSFGRRKTHRVRVPKPTTSMYDIGYELITCPTCNGKGVTTPSRVEREAPTCWIPRDVGLVVIDGRGSKLVKRAPRRREVPVLNEGELGQFVRWISMRPDPRHAAAR